jgi:hypothetical protein
MNGSTNNNYFNGMRYNQSQKNITGMSQQMGHIQASMGNFNQAYTPGMTQINKPDFTNKGEVIHNNLGDRLFSESIVEYKIHIDSHDRKISSFPSPFKFKILFGDTFEQFTIARKFQNVKYVTLDSIILPRTISLDLTKVAEPNIYPAHSEFITPRADQSINVLSTLSKRKYLIVKIDEFESVRNLGTSIFIDKNTFILSHDCCMGMDSSLWKPIHSTVIFQNSLLRNINGLTITIFDEYGNELKLSDTLGNPIIGRNIIGLDKDYNKFVSENIDTESVKYTDNITQTEFNFTFGVVENELNTNTSYN